MAMYHLAYKHASRAQGYSARAHADYIARSGPYGHGPVHEQLAHVEHANMPAWAQDDPRAFWQAADTYERANGRLYTEIELALPRELSTAEQITLVRVFVADHIGPAHPTSWAIHHSPAMDGGLNPHVHIMFTERRLDGIEREPAQFFRRANAEHPERGGAGKDRAWNRQEQVHAIREAWAQTANQALERAGHTQRIDHRSLAAQGIDRHPEPHLGRDQTAMLRRGAPTELGAQVLELRQDRERLAQVERAIGETQAQLIDLAQARAARQAQREAQQAREAETPARQETPEETFQRLRAQQRETPEETFQRLRAQQQDSAEQAFQRLVAQRDRQLEAARLELERTTGVPHTLAATPRLRGRVVDRVELAGTPFARIAQEGGYVLVPWQSDMAPHRGHRVTLELSGQGTLSRVLRLLSDEDERQRGRALQPDLSPPEEERERRSRDPDRDLGW